MKRVFWITLFGIFLFPGLAIAQKTRLAAALMDDEVLLTSNFNGAKLSMFGAVALNQNNDVPDIIIIVRGPNRPAWINEKSRKMGLWIGQERANFSAAPTFYGVVSNRNIDEIAPKDTQSLYGITPTTQLIVAENSQTLKNLEDLKNAFVRVRQSQKLYLNVPQGVKFLENGLFRADLRLPDLTPPGLYTVKVMVMRNKRPVDTTLQTFVVTKVGIEQFLFNFARDQAILHALLGVIMALSAGFFSARVFRRFRT